MVERSKDREMSVFWKRVQKDTLVWGMRSRRVGPFDEGELGRPSLDLHSIVSM